MGRSVGPQSQRMGRCVGPQSQRMGMSVGFWTRCNCCTLHTHSETEPITYPSQLKAAAWGSHALHWCNHGYTALTPATNPQPGWCKKSSQCVPWRSRQGTWHKERSLSEKGRELTRIMGEFDQRMLCIYGNVKEYFLKRQGSKNVEIFCTSFKAIHDKSTSMRGITHRVQ